MSLLSSSYGNDNSFLWRLLLAVCMIFIIVSSSDVAFATGDPEHDIIGSALCRLVGNLTGGIAKGIAIMAIFAAGIGIFLGKLKWEIAASIAVGVAIIFAAPQLLAFLTGVGENANCTVIDPVAAP